MNSCIYNGEVTHTRFKPVRHFLKYKTFSLLIDLDEINELDCGISIFSHNKFKILGIMWHPERYKKIKNFDKNLIKNFLS